MINYRIIIISTIVFFALSCKSSSKLPKPNAPTINPIEESKNKIKNTFNCDSMVEVVNRSPYLFKPILLLEPKEALSPAQLENNNDNNEYYHIKIKYVRNINKYEVWFDDIKMVFTIDNIHCVLTNSIVNCYINQTDLADQCINLGYDEYTDPAKKKYKGNGLQCIYFRKWDVKVRGIICDNNYTQFSKIINSIQTQCQ